MIRQSFIYPDIKPEHYVFGALNAGKVIREDGDWRDYTPPTRLQIFNGVEPSDCYVIAQLHALSTIQEEEFNIPDQVYAPRFNTLLSDGTENGGDPLKGADSIRGDGIIVDSMMPFDSSITSWDDFHSWKGANEKLCRMAGQLFKQNWKANNYIVFKREESVEAKYAKLREALKRSPVPLSVYGKIDNNLQYVPKSEGDSDTHLVLCTYLSPDNKIYIRDTYAPFDKVLPDKYNPDFALRWTVEKLEARVKVSFGSMIVDLFKKIFNRDYRMFGSVRSPKWSEIRNKWVKENPLCAVCSTKKDCEVHHVQPYHLHPDLELNPQNFITLCRPHHYIFGHFMNWSSFNKDVRADAELWKQKISNRP